METEKNQEKKEKLTYWDKFFGGKGKIPYQPPKQKPYLSYSERQERRKEALKGSELCFEALKEEILTARRRETEKDALKKAKREAKNGPKSA